MIKQDLFIAFLWIGTTLSFFHSSGNTTSFRQFLKKISSSYHMESSNNFNIRMLIMSFYELC